MENSISPNFKRQNISCLRTTSYYACKISYLPCANHHSAVACISLIWFRTSSADPWTAAASLGSGRQKRHRTAAPHQNSVVQTQDPSLRRRSHPWMLLNLFMTHCFTVRWWWSSSTCLSVFERLRLPRHGLPYWWVLHGPWIDPGNPAGVPSTDCRHYWYLWRY